MGQLLFVYGTLRPRCRHPMAVFLSSRAVPRGEAKTAGRLYDLGRYPAAVPSSDPNDWVHGDVFELDGATLAELDAYEDVESPQPSYFGRQLGDVEMTGGDVFQAWIYWFHGPLPPQAVFVASGEYGKIFPATDV